MRKPCHCLHNFPKGEGAGRKNKYLHGERKMATTRRTRRTGNNRRTGVAGRTGRTRITWGCFLVAILIPGILPLLAETMVHAAAGAESELSQTPVLPSSPQIVVYINWDGFADTIWIWQKPRARFQRSPGLRMQTGSFCQCHKRDRRLPTLCRRSWRRDHLSLPATITGILISN